MEINIILLNGNHYGLPTETVQEVCDTVSITPLPFSPEYVDGLVNIGGLVIVQIDLTVQLGGTPTRKLESGQLVIVQSAGETIALHVDQALLMVNVSEDEIHSVQVNEIPDGVEANLLTGVFKWKDQSVLYLDVDQLGLKTIAPLASDLENNGVVATTETESAVNENHKNDSLVSYLVVESCGERYALDMERVCSVEDLEVITALPLAPPEVVGMTYSHKSPVLVLGLGLLMGQRVNIGSKLVIVQHQDFRCALIVEHIHGIQRLACHENHEVLANDGELGGYLLGEEKRLIGVLNFDVLFSSQRIQSLRRFLVDDHHLRTRKDKIPTCRLLTFSVGDERCALPLALVNRVVEYCHVKPLPEGGGQHLHGAIQIHGDILPVVDLRVQMDSDPKITALTAYVVAGEEDNRWALVVDQVNRVVEIPEKDLEPTSFNEQQYVEAIGRMSGGLLNVINLEAITASMATECRR